ncbi:MAG: GNAT family N-acetyltransferase [Robiginitomaculum sp.]|nr:MAG: GNAT family N-acetyltransferase [Robiginitomaculum sp.]
MVDITVRIARSLDELMHVFSVRTLVYIGEQACPYEEEYDGNDFTGASHIIAYVNGEPVGVLRLRWFAMFVKFERAAVIKEYRKFGVIKEIMNFSFMYSKKRGYRKIIIHAQSQLRRYWRRFGFTERQGRAEFSYSDYDYVEMEKVITPSNEAINMNTNPMRLNRPDGEWDKGGVLDLSVARSKKPLEKVKIIEAA